MSPSGTGSGVVTSNPSGINCGATCASPYATGTVVTLTAAANPNSNFGGWSGGGCSGTGSCVVTMSAAQNVTATFTLKTWQLSVSVTGTGTVASNPVGISCGPTCIATFNDATVVTLTPSPGSGQMFSAWGGACSGSGTCQVTMTQAQSVTATFVPQVFGISVTKTGSNGSGLVTSNVGGINCGATCNAPFTAGTIVTLTAAESLGSTFVGWSGAGCNGTGTCVITVAGPTTVNAVFTLKQYQLAVSLAGPAGSGSVSSNPGGINCGGTCAASYDHGTVVTLTATPTVGNNFVGWSGACSGAGACVVTMDNVKSVSATFAAQTFTLGTTVAGLGAGSITSNPGGISCGIDCSEVYPYNTVVTLTATPQSNSTFVGWSGGGCSGIGTCVVTMTAAQNVTATFNLISLTVSHGGNGFGSVSSVPSGINGCTPSGGTCLATYNNGTVVTLTATPENAIVARLSTFGGWSGGCSGMGTCVVTMSAATSVTANWILRPNTAFITQLSTNAAFGGPAGGDTLCKNAAQAVGLVGTYKALVGTPSVSMASQLGSASGWVRVDGKPLANTTADALAGRWFYPLRITTDGSDVGNVTVWTFSDAANCAEFTSVSTGGFATHGPSTGQGGYQLNSGGLGCSGQNRLYCFGIDRAAAVTVTPPNPRRLAFITANTWPSGGGLSGADSLCQAEATGAGLSGTFLALLATKTATAASRFNANGPVWTRTDGVPLAPVGALFGPPLIDSAPNLSATGTTHFGNVGVWGGATNFTTVGTAASTCSSATSDWNLSAAPATAYGGRAGQTSVQNLFGQDTSDSCAAMNNHLICLQQ